VALNIGSYFLARNFATTLVYDDDGFGVEEENGGEITCRPSLAGALFNAGRSACERVTNWNYVVGFCYLTDGYGVVQL